MSLNILYRNVVVGVSLLIDEYTVTREISMGRVARDATEAAAAAEEEEGVDHDDDNGIADSPSVYGSGVGEMMADQELFLSCNKARHATIGMTDQSIV
jgi:hypothetical protein